MRESEEWKCFVKANNIAVSRLFCLGLALPVGTEKRQRFIFRPAHHPDGRQEKGQQEKGWRVKGRLRRRA